MSELKMRNRQIKEKKIMNKDEVYHGALEDILLGKKKLSKKDNIACLWQAEIRQRYNFSSGNISGVICASSFLVKLWFVTMQGQGRHSIPQNSCGYNMIMSWLPLRLNYKGIKSK